MQKLRQPPPLNITCSDSDCDNDLHCFHQTEKNRIAYPNGECVECGKALIDWKRVRRRQISDVVNTFEELRIEYWRHSWWHRDIDVRAINHARRKGRVNLKDCVYQRLRSSVAIWKPFIDGRQTGKEENIIFYAQHATATCCRKCIEHWHGIPKAQVLTDDEIEYFADLIMMYVLERLPDLADTPIEVPFLRKKTK